ncbi:MAG: DUF2236 domain-containing protein [Chloroflexi bacterium]|nr:DUF2236 domain-containing protein [Chloroflexota bacterium]
MPRRRILEQILTLDPLRDHQQIVFLDACHEFPFDVTRADEFAFYRTFAVPSIGGLLHRTGEFEKRTQKRYDDTKLIISEIVEHGYDSERGRQAIRQLNRIHGRYAISNEDFLYVLSTLVFEPIRWMARFAYRPMVEHEKLALFYFWREVGRRMNIKAIPEDIEGFELFNLDYERARFHRTDAGHGVASATRDMFLGWFLPRFLRPLGRPFIYAIMDDRLLEASGFSKPPPGLRGLVHGLLRLRSRLTRLRGDRRRPFLRTVQKHTTYPKGYRVEELGPPLDR